MTSWNEKSTSFRHAKQYFLCELSLERHLTHSTHTQLHTQPQTHTDSRLSLQARYFHLRKPIGKDEAALR